MRLSDKILILGNGGVKNSRTYEEDDSLRGYVLTLQKFEELLKEGMKDIRNRYREMVARVPQEMKEEINLSFAISNKIDALMQERGLSKKEFADQLGKRPSEITRWLSGQHNFTVSTLAMLSAFFGKSIISV